MAGDRVHITSYPDTGDGAHRRDLARANPRGGTCDPVGRMVLRGEGGTTVPFVACPPPDAGRWRAQEGVGRAIAIYDVPIEGRDEWLAAARRLA